MNAEVVETYEDLAISAFRGRNMKGALGRFLQRVKDGEVCKGDILIVESLDRISRQQEFDAISILIEILQSGVVIHTLADGRVYDVKDGQQANALFQMNFIVSRAHDESLTKQRRSKSAWAKKHLEAKQTQQVMTSKLPYWLQAENDNGSIKVSLNESRAEEVRFAYKLASFKLGAQAIATRLNERGCEKRWSLIAVRHLLNAKSVYGALEIYKTKSIARTLENGEAYELVEGYYPSVISKEEFYRVQSEIEINKQQYALRGRASKGFRNVFKGVISCAYCGSKLHQNFLRRKGHEYMYLVCQRSLVGACGVQSKLLYTYDRILSCFLLLYKSHGLGELIKQASPHVSLREKTQALNAEKTSRYANLDSLKDQIKKSMPNIPRALVELITENEQRIDELDAEINKLMGLSESSKVLQQDIEQLTRESIESVLEEEEGRLRFNSLLSKNKISIIMGREFHSGLMGMHHDAEGNDGSADLLTSLTKAGTSHSMMSIFYEGEDGVASSFAHIEFDRYKAKFGLGSVYEFKSKLFWPRADYDFESRKFRELSRPQTSDEDTNSYLSNLVVLGNAT
jgi:DNA invertase Pin-like site-specific DNA recombinase